MGLQKWNEAPEQGANWTAKKIRKGKTKAPSGFEPPRNVNEALLRPPSPRVMGWDSHTSSWQTSMWLPLSTCKMCHLLVAGGQPFGPHLSVLGGQEMETTCSSACAGASSPSLPRHACTLLGEAALILHEHSGWLPCQGRGGPGLGMLQEQKQ